MAVIQSTYPAGSSRTTVSGSPYMQSSPMNTAGFSSFLERLMQTREAERQEDRALAKKWAKSDRLQRRRAINRQKAEENRQRKMETQDRAEAKRARKFSEKAARDQAAYEQSLRQADIRGPITRMVSTGYGYMPQEDVGSLPWSMRPKTTQIGPSMPSRAGLSPSQPAVDYSAMMPETRADFLGTGTTDLGAQRAELIRRALRKGGG